ncbi:MAG: response regulator transcription factor [Verrucomicrobiota bacterium]|nr:response regulator transcription factor [Verrucomicrobiota bacterium]MDQ6939698.1 response regulator transcription factor [Verrucomicrobiota bacterium]
MNAPHEIKKRRVVIVEDHPMFREQLRLLIDKEEDLAVCGETDNVPAALALIQKTQPQLAIIDITLKGANGLDLLKDLRAQEIDLPVLVLSMHDESLYAERALRAGARGYITKQEASAKVMIAIRQVLSGEIYLDARVMRQMVDKVVAKSDDAVSAIDRLTDRELEVFELIGQGRTTREIGYRLSVGLTTVDTYRARIKEKLRLENAAQLHAEAARWVATQVAVAG